MPMMTPLPANSKTSREALRVGSQRPTIGVR